MNDRWFEHTASSGVLEPGTQPEDGIFSGLNPDDFVGPDNAGYLEGTKNLDECPYYRLSAEGTVSDWAEDFANNPCELSRPRHSGGMHGRLNSLLDLADMVNRLQPHWRSPHIFRRQLYRANIPNGGKTATGVHYDHIFLRGGPPTALTAWVPIGDCTPSQGGLMYLENSKSLGQELEAEFTKSAKESGLSEEEMKSAFNKNVRYRSTYLRLVLSGHR